ncbi:NAD(P)/FAD-dependent oxidoreductase [Reyranella sp.]|uniref:NAD(P)/FAD-dependent oxidoreductase n=1 Tax=Reyranella sp. TaxID=1929291 RepID=UPI003BA971E9
MENPGLEHHDDLRDGRAPWRAGGRPRRLSLEQDRRCDVLVVGAGITGALVAETLSARGLDVAVVDRERPGLGSTAASTAMLLWEIDKPLGELTALYGFERAAALYRRSLRAVSGLARLVRALDVSCALRPRRSLYLAAGETGEAALQAEHALRRRAGLPGAFVDYRDLRRDFGFDREAALLSPGSFDADPLCLAHGLLDVVIARGVSVYDADAVAFDGGGRTAFVGLEDGRVIEADRVVLATGYVMPDIVRSDLHRIASTWAIATPPQSEGERWRDGLLLWEASETYLYARTTVDDRLIVGGEDDEEAVTPEKRAAVTPEKTSALLRKLESLFPQARAVAELSWAGAFGITEDGLPLIGAVPGHPRFLAAYGYGGNGITFAYMASRLIAATIAGRRLAWADDVAIDRPVPPSVGEVSLAA